MAYPSLVQLLMAWLLRCAALPATGDTPLRLALLGAATHGEVGAGEQMAVMRGLLREMLWRSTVVDTVAACAGFPGEPPPPSVATARRSMMLHRAAGQRVRAQQARSSPT